MKLFKIRHQTLKKNTLFLKKIFLNRGFSILGVMVASAVGLIVVSGVSQLFVNMSSEIKNQEENSAKVFFSHQIGEDLKDNCTETLSHVKLQSDDTVSVISKLLLGEEVKFTKILRDDGDPDTESTDVIIDLSEPSEREKLSAQYGMTGDIHFLLRCTDFSRSCNCVPVGDGCEKKRWTLTFISQSREKSFLKYMKNSHFDLDIKFTQKEPPKLECDVTGMGTSFSRDCFRITSHGATLAGCGTTTEEGALIEALFLTILTKRGYGGTTAFGYNTANKWSIGSFNTFIGYEAGQYDSTNYIAREHIPFSQKNTYVGYQAGQLSENGVRYNTFVGYQAGQANDHIYDPYYTSGYDSSYVYNSGWYNTFIGSQAGLKNTFGWFNTFIGHSAGSRNTTGTANVIINPTPSPSEEENTGNRNIFIGSQAGEFNTTGGAIYAEFPAFISELSDLSEVDEVKANRELYNKGEHISLPDKAGNVFLGALAGQHNTTGSGNTFIGYAAGNANTEGEKNTFVGTYAGVSNQASGNVFLGYAAGAYNINGEGNTFLGYQAGGKTRTVWTADPDDPDDTDRMTASAGDGNTFVGYEAGYNNTTGDNNVFQGFESGHKNRTGDNNVFIGHHAGKNNRTGDDNIFIGTEAGYDTTGNNNVFLGHQAGKTNTGGDDNVFIGFSAGYDNIGGDENVFIGYQAGGENTSGSGNIFIGEQAGNTTDYTTKNNYLVIGNNSDKDWIEGKIGTSTFEVNGQQVLYRSSRTLKKNIRPFQNFEKALEDILKTPLFTFEYKKDNPEKSRMGVISEELPPHLQLFNDSNVSYPDIPSLYGTFWASIKALYFKLQDLKQEFANLKKSFIDFEEQNDKSFTDFKKQNEESFNQLQQNFSHFKKKREKTDSHLFHSFTRFIKENKTFKEKQDSKAKAYAQAKKNLKETQKKLFQTEKELLEVKTQFQRELSHIQKELTKLQSVD